MPKGNSGESCPAALRIIFQNNPGPHCYSKIKALLHEKGKWTDTTIRRMVMSAIVNLPPAREEWSTEPFLMLGKDGRLEKYDELIHGSIIV